VWAGVPSASVEYDVRPLLSGDGSYGFVLATSSNDGIDFHSREASDTSRRPRLVLTFVSGSGETAALSGSSAMSSPAGSSALLASAVEVDSPWG
jgi:hypothetical protein